MWALLEDIRDALRQIRRAPGFAALVVLTLGSAMGVGTAFFSMINLSWFKPWNVREPDELAVSRFGVRIEKARYLKERTKSFRDLAWASQGWGRLEGRTVYPVSVSPNYFEVLGVPIVRGREFLNVETPDGETEAIVTDQTWKVFFDSDPEIIGRIVPLVDTAARQTQMVRIVGVAAAGFEGPYPMFRARIFLPFSAYERESRSKGRVPVHAGGIFGRLAPGVAISQAQAELQMLDAAMTNEVGGRITRPMELTATDGLSRNPPGDRSVGQVYTLLLAVACLSMVACANVSNLFLARGHARRGEIAVRLSLGAPRSRIVRRLLIEALLLSLAAGAVGTYVASMLPQHVFAAFPLANELVQFSLWLDWRTLLWAAGFSTFACVVFGLSPALISTRLDLARVLKDAEGVSAPSLKTSLTSMQCLVSVAALGVAGLVMRSGPFVQAGDFLRALDSITVVSALFGKDADHSRAATTIRTLFKGLESGLGSRRVAGASRVPRQDLAGNRVNLGVTSEYFGVLGLRVIEGRTFAPDETGADVVVVNEGLAQALWPGEAAIGKRLLAADTDGHDRTVIGIVRDTSLSGEASYWPVEPSSAAIFFVRGRGTEVRHALSLLRTSIDPAVDVETTAGPVWAVRRLGLAVFLSRLLSGFGLYVLLLAGVGLFSLMDYAVRQRTREIGVRRALGAGRIHVLQAVLRPVFQALGGGLVAGTFVALIGGLLMRYFNLPEGVNPFDPATYSTVAVVVAAAAIVATWHPSRRALRIEPVVALRCE